MKSKKLIYTIITILWIAVIFGFSLQPATVSNNVSGSILTRILAPMFPQIMENKELAHLAHLLVRKAAHFTEYMVLGMLSVNAIQYYLTKKLYVMSAGFCVVIAMIDETIQLFVPGRDGRFWDVLIDSSGAIVGIVLFMLFTYLFKKNHITPNNSEKIIK